MLCPHVTSAAPYEIENVVHPPHENLLNLCHLWAMNRSLLVKIPLHLCMRNAGREILVSSRLGPRMESTVNMNEQAHDNMSASHWRCGIVNGRGVSTFSLACKERINALNISD